METPLFYLITHLAGGLPTLVDEAVSHPTGEAASLDPRR